jgi:hypothetical protein
MAVMLAGSNLLAQTSVWSLPGPTVTSTTNFGYYIEPFPDQNGDGVADLLLTVGVSIGTPSQTSAVQIVSGLDGSVLYQQTSPQNNFIRAVPAGDMDGDGVCDFLVTLGGGTSAVELWSKAQRMPLWTFPGSTNGLFGQAALLGHLDVNGDHAFDCVTITSHPTESAVYVIDHSGQLLYQWPALQLGYLATSLATIGDIDGDNADDILVGCLDPSNRGAVVALSGRTGSVIRVTYGQQPGDRSCSSVTNIGDIDGDGVPDYAVASMAGATRFRVVIHSGASGALIREIAFPAQSLLGNVDLDLDGIPDLICGADGYPVGPNQYGRVQAFSGRDGGTLWTLDVNQTGSNSQIGLCSAQAVIGVLPGNPYPVTAWIDTNWISPTFGHGRVEARRGACFGVGSVSGSSCSSSGPTPRIGVRQFGGGTGIIIANASPGAIAFLSLAMASDSQLGGVSVPLSLTAFGLTNCTLYVPPVVSTATLTGVSPGSAGYGIVVVPHALTSGNGFDVAAQWLAFDNVGGFAATTRQEFRIQ